MTNHIASIADVVAAVRGRGVPASHEYPGFVLVPGQDGESFEIGTANATWTADRRIDGGETPTAVLVSDIPSTEVDVARIADWIVSAVRTVELEREKG